MENQETTNGESMNIILSRIQSLEDRLAKIESKLSLGDASVISSPLETSAPVSDDKSEFERDQSDAFWESNVGKYGLSWLANIVFIFGVAFVMSYSQSIGNSSITVMLGFAGVLGMFVFGYLLRNIFHFVSFSIYESALILLFYVTAYLHFFSEDPLLSSKVAAIVLLFIVIAIQLYFAVRQNSETLAGVGILMCLITAILSNATHMMLPIVVVAAMISVYFVIRHEWWRIFIISILLVYLTHLFWLFNNPFMGNQMQIVDSHQHDMIYLFLYAAVFSLPLIKNQWEKLNDSVFVSSMLLNALGFFLTIFLVVISFYTENYAWIFGIMTVLFLLYSIVLKIKSNLRYAPAFYSCFGFMALSVAIYGYFGLPDSFLLLALESLLVLLMAIWFKSTIIVVANVVLFFVLLIFYISTSGSVDSVNFAFALVALATARILNWKKERLSLQTDHFRNFYLIAAFVMVLYALFQAVPSDYVTVAWTGVAGIYFALSFILKNVKYRWMTILTLIVTAFHLFIVDLKNMDTEYRILSLIFLAVISLSASLYYTKKLSNKSK